MNSLEDDCPPWQAIMRFVPSNLAYAAIGLVTIVATIGCNADPNCRREIALLRSEILDLEDQNAILRSRYEGTAAELSTFTGEPVDMRGISSSGGYESVVIEDVPGSVMYQNMPGEIQLAPGEVIISETPISNGTIYDSQISPQIETIENRPAENIVPNNSGVPSATPEAGRDNQPSNLPTAAPRSNPASQLPLPETLRNDQGRRAPQRSNRLSFGMARARTNRPAATEIVIHRSATHGYSVDEEPGDEGLNLLIQPKSSDGQIRLETGELTVSVINPKAPPASQRIGRWKFLPEETELFFVNDELASHGILLHLPWEKATPTHPRLVVHARLTTDDGRILQTSREVRIRPPASDYSPDDPKVLAWTQQDWRWGLGAAGASEAELSVTSKDDGSSYDAFDLAIEDDMADSESGDQRDWRKSREPAGVAAQGDGPFRRRRPRAQPASTQKTTKPKWRPVR